MKLTTWGNTAASFKALHASSPKWPAIPHPGAQFPLWTLTWVILESRQKPLEQTNLR